MSTATADFLDASKEVASDIGKGAATLALITGVFVAVILLCSGCFSVMAKTDNDLYDTVEATVTEATCVPSVVTNGTYDCNFKFSYNHNGVSKEQSLSSLASKSYAKNEKFLIEVLKTDSNSVRLPVTSAAGFGYILIAGAVFLMAACSGSWWYVTHTEGKGVKWILIMLGLCTIVGCIKAMIK